MATNPIGADHGLVTNNTTDGFRAVSIDTINMIAQINVACRAHRMPVSTFGRRAVNDPRLVPDLIDGRSLRPTTRAKILQFIATMGQAAVQGQIRLIDPDEMPDVYALTGKGTCMEPLFADGALLVGDKRETPKPGDTVFVHFGREAAQHYHTPGWVKRLVQIWPGAFGEDLVILQQLNPRRSYLVPSRCIAAMHKCVGTATRAGDGLAYFRSAGQGA